MAKQETPVDDALRLVQQGMSDPEIIRNLSEQGYSPVQITDALNQAKIKKEISKEEGLEPSIMTQEIQVPSPSIPVPRPGAMAVPSPMSMAPQPISVTAEYPYQYPTYENPQEQKVDTEVIEEIAEEIVNEKWLEIKGKISDVIEWKVYAEKRISSIDERIKRIEMSLDRLQAALLTKVQEYGRNIKDLGTEMAGLEGAFGNILTPFVENMKELGKITGELKSVKTKVKPKAQVQSEKKIIKKVVTKTVKK